MVMATNGTLLDIELLPIFPPPPGQVSNFIDPDDQMTATVSIHVVCLAFLTVFVVMRIYTRRYIIGKLRLDDYFCILSYLSSIVFAAFQLTSQANGLGRHVWDIHRKDIARAIKPFSLGVYVYNLYQMFVKLTCLLFYRHLFCPKRKTLWFVNAGIGFVVWSYLSLIVAALAQCHPFAYAWNKTIPGGHCFQPMGLSYASGALNCFSDIYILLVPIPAVMSLPLGTARKLRIIGVFALGLLGCAVSVVRIVLMTVEWGSTDFTWQGTRVGLVSILECDIGLICACLFVFPAFLKHHKKSLPNWLMRLGETEDDSYVSQNKPDSSLPESTPSDGSLFVPGPLERGNLDSVHAAGDEEAWTGHNRTPPLTQTDGI